MQQWGGGVVYDLNFSLTAVLKLSNNNRCQITVSASLSNKTNILDGEKAGWVNPDAADVGVGVFHVWKPACVLNNFHPAAPLLQSARRSE